MQEILTASLLPADFSWLTRQFGAEKGTPHYDHQADVVHEIYPDRVRIWSGFLNNAHYDITLADNQLQVSKTRLDNYKLGERAREITDRMEDADRQELAGNWQHLLQELRQQSRLRGMNNVRDTMAQLYLEIFPEEEAVEQITLLPEVVVPQPFRIWEILQDALQQTGNLVSFEWSAFEDTGIFTLNELAPLQLAGVLLEPPSPEELEEIFAADDYPSAWMNFVNAQLDEYELKLIATGTHLDEWQSFTCLSMEDLRLAHAMEHFKTLCLLCFF